MPGEWWSVLCLIDSEMCDAVLCSGGREGNCCMQELYCAVELHGSLTRGMSTFDWNKTLQRTPNVALVKRVNLEGFNAMMDASTN